MFQIEHRQGVEPVFAFNICCIALNASLCSSLEHVLAFKMRSMKNICVQVLHTGSVQYYRTRSRCSISVALLVCYVAVCNNYAICNKLQTALNCNAVCNTPYFKLRCDGNAICNVLQIASKFYHLKILKRRKKIDQRQNA